MIAIIDYGMGNLRSVQKGFEKLGFAAEVTADPQVLLEADKVVLPGVGAFPDCMRNLEQGGFVDPILRVISEGRPFLGICLGLQVAMIEFARSEGIGVEVSVFAAVPSFPPEVALLLQLAVVVWCEPGEWVEHPTVFRSRREE